MTGLPYPTPTRLKLADAIDSPDPTVRVYGYPDWENGPQAYLRDGLNERLVTARVVELIAAGLARWDRDTGGSGGARVVLTDEGRAWRQRARRPG